MKKFTFQHFVILLAFISCFFGIYSFLNAGIPVIIRYVAIAVFAVSLTYLYMLKVGNRNQKRLEWLEERQKLWNSISYRALLLFHSLGLRVMRGLCFRTQTKHF
jgi:hypothetical protein